MEKNIKKYNIPIFIPDYGCPFQCIFCNQKTITQTSQIPNFDEISNKIIAWTQRGCSSYNEK